MSNNLAPLVCFYSIIECEHHLPPGRGAHIPPGRDPPEGNMAVRDNGREELLSVFFIVESLGSAFASNGDHPCVMTNQHASQYFLCVRRAFQLMLYRLSSC